MSHLAIVQGPGFPRPDLQHLLEFLHADPDLAVEVFSALKVAGPRAHQGVWIGRMRLASEGAALSVTPMARGFQKLRDGKLSTPKGWEWVVWPDPTPDPACARESLQIRGEADTWEAALEAGEQQLLAYGWAFAGGTP